MRAFFGIGLMVLSSFTARSQVTDTVSVQDAALTLMGQIQIADHAGDRSALRRLHDDLAALRSPHLDSYLVSRIEYWKGFALWRRALNGFSAGIDQTDLEGDLSLAVRHFEEALKYDEGFTDANVGIISCLQNLAHLKRDDPAVRKQLVSRFVPLLKQSLAAAPDNPRLLWVLGAGQWYNPPERSGGQALAVATYQRGLELAREQRGLLRKPLDPAWGEPELLMNLALASLNGTPSNPRSAEQYATQALALVPHWRYVRDVLLPQIRRASDQSKLLGEWEGTYTTSRLEGKLWIRVGQEEGGVWTVSVKATSPEVDPPAFQSASAVKVDGNAISFVVQWGEPTEFNGRLGEGLIAGEIAAPHWSGRWSVRRPSGR